MSGRILLSILIGVISVGPAVAQKKSNVSAQSIGIGVVGNTKFYYANRNEPPRAIEFKPATITMSSLLANINQYVNIPAEFTFTQIESNTDKLGMQHRLLQQHYKGIPVEGMVYRVHEQNGFVKSMNGKA